jgi:ribosome recycling factor
MSNSDLEANMRKSVEATQRNFNTIRTGRANPSLLDRINVEYYGADTPLKSLASLSTPDSQTIAVQPFDMGSLALIEKAIATSDLGFTPNNDGKVIRINVPPSYRRTQKRVLQACCKVFRRGKGGIAQRASRRHRQNQETRKEGDLSEDQSRDEQDQVQKTTDRFIAELEKHLADKEVEILKV